MPSELRRKRGPVAVMALALLAIAIPLHGQGNGGYAYPGAPAVQPAYASSAPPLSPGDAIAIQFWQEPQLSGQFPIDEQGLVVLPILGIRQVTMWPADQVKQQLVAEYARQLRDQPAQIRMLRRVRVLGGVRTAGLYHVDPTMSLGDVVAMAGGPDQNARQDQIRVYRGGQLLHARLDGSVVLPDLRSGDQIVVPQTSWIERNAAFVVSGALSALAIILRS